MRKFAVAPLIIELATGTAREREARQVLFDLPKYLPLERLEFTERIRIQEGVIPHSHPVLTIGLLPFGSIEPDRLLATFVHEQIHWFLIGRREVFRRILSHVRSEYTWVPVAPPEGAGSAFGTYAHIIVCGLEYHVLVQLIGPTRSRHVFETNQHYRWIYRKVLSDFPRIRYLIEETGWLTPLTISKWRQGDHH